MQLQTKGKVLCAARRETHIYVLTSRIVRAVAQDTGRAPREGTLTSGSKQYLQKRMPLETKGDTVESQLYVSQLKVPLLCTSNWYSVVQNTYGVVWRIIFTCTSQSFLRPNF